MANLFSDTILKKLVDANRSLSTPVYTIGVSDYDSTFSYCLTYKFSGTFQFLLCKTMHDRKEFYEEVKNLSKYFNATIFTENRQLYSPIDDININQSESLVEFFNWINDGLYDKLKVPKDKLL